MNSSMKVFRDNIRFLLDFYRITQVELAKTIAVDPTHLSHFLNATIHSDAWRDRGKTQHVLSANRFDVIASFFGVDLWMLFRDDLSTHVEATVERPARAKRKYTKRRK